MSWCFTPSQPVRLYQGDPDLEEEEEEEERQEDGDDEERIKRAKINLLHRPVGVYEV